MIYLVFCCLSCRKERPLVEFRYIGDKNFFFFKMAYYLILPCVDKHFTY